MSIKNKIILLLVFSIITITAISSVMSYTQAKNALQENHEVTALAQLERVSEYLSKFITDATNVVEHLAKEEVAVNADGKLSSYVSTTADIFPRYEELNDYEKRIFHEFIVFNQAFPYYALIYMGTEDGGFAQAPDDALPAGYDPRTRDWYKDAAKNPTKTLFSEGYISTTSSLVYTIAKAITKEGTVEGVVAIDVDIRDLSDFFNNIRIGNTGYLMVLEENGLVVADSMQNDNLGKNIKDLEKKALASILDRNSGTTTISMGNRDYIASFVTTELGWKVVLLIESDEITGSAWQMTKTTMLISLLTAVILVLIGLFSANTITAPLNTLIGSVGKISEGDFNALPKNAHYSGEIQKLYTSLTGMTKQLAELIETSHKKSEEAMKALKSSEQATNEANAAKLMAQKAHAEGMHQAAKSLMESVNIIVDATKSLHEQVNSTEEKINAQAHSIVHATGIVEEMNITVGEVGHNAASASKASAQTRILAEDGLKSVGDVVANMEKIESNAVTLKADMQDLNTHTIAISQIMSIISDIADQTNLLALNAAIEAARAGEAGRGFAVVADEVRKLAEKTMTSTTQVSSTVQAIQFSVENNMRQVDATVENIELTTVEAKKFNNSLNEIVEMANTSNAQVNNITEVSRIQSTKSQEVHGAISQINRVAQETSQTMAQASQAVEALNRQAQILNTLIEDMERV